MEIWVLHQERGISSRDSAAASGDPWTSFRLQRTSNSTLVPIDTANPSGLSRIFSDEVH